MKTNPLKYQVGFLDLGIAHTSSGAINLNQGKLRTKLLPVYARYLARYGYGFRYESDVRAFTGENRPRAVFLIYNESIVEKHGQWGQIAQAEALLDAAEVPVFQGERVGRLVASKAKITDFYLEQGIPTPAKHVGEHADTKVFSNTLVGSGDAVKVLDKGNAIDPKRHNVDLIDTTVAFRGVSYYTSIRALCVGSHCISAYVRVRPVSDGSPSVHTKDTPRHLSLLRELHRRLVDDRRSEINELSVKIGRGLGPGFYAHDLLPCAQSQKYLVCESGYKFSDWTYRRHLGWMGLFTRAPEMATNQILNLSARALSEELRSQA